MNDTTMSDQDFLEMILKRGCEKKTQLSNTCEDNGVQILLMGYGFLFLFCLAMIGNCLNLFIYNSGHIKYYLAIRMLCTRLLMNNFTMLSLLPTALRTIQVWPAHADFDLIYWRLWPYTTFAGNLFGFSAMWLTVLMIGECYLHIFVPARSKAVCTPVNLRKCYVIIFVVGGILTLIYPINRTAMLVRDTCGDRDTIIIQQTYNSTLFNLWERVNTVANALISLGLPLLLLVFMTLAIFCKMQWRAKEDTKSHFSSEKRSVVRLTLITTGLQLLDSPTIIEFLYAAMRGPAASECVFHAVALFLGLCNMSISFYSYLLFSPRFREMFIVRLQDTLACVFPCWAAGLAQTKRRSTGVTRLLTPSPSGYCTERRSQVPSHTIVEEEKLTGNNNRDDAFV